MRTKCASLLVSFSGRRDLMSSWTERLRNQAIRNRREIIKARLSRREMIKLGLVTSAGTLALKSGLSARADNLFPISPPTRPFVVPLPIPDVIQPVSEAELFPRPGVNPVGGEAPRPPFQALDRFPPQQFYLLHQRNGTHVFHPDLPPNPIFGFEGKFPGPTFHTRLREPILVRNFNLLEEDETGFGIPSTSTHLHNGHNPSESDGFPADFYDSGLFKDFHYPNLPAGGIDANAEHTQWMHDHRIDFTTQNVYKGLACFYLTFDDRFDTGDETTGLRLPSGAFDVPMVFADKVFDRDGQLFFDLFNLDGILGDKFTVNGIIQPFFSVRKRKYRLRLLNSGPSRWYEFFLSNGQPFIQIASDGNLLPRPVVRQSVRISVAERVDVIVDFTDARPGEPIYLLNRLEQKDGRGPTFKLLNPGDRLVRFDVEDGTVDDPSRVPPVLVEPEPIDLSIVAARRTWEFNRDNGAWTVNGEFFDPDVSRARPRLNTAEIWTFVNKSGGWSHPIHVHHSEFRILSVNGKPPQAFEAGAKDMVQLGPNDVVSIYQRYRDFTGKYPMHCHNTVHEDHAMMIRFDVVP
jgi:FtsP/CotA-like multicopper oxidase with cupredoxin domain